MPRFVMASRTSCMPPGKRLGAGSHAPTESHQPWASSSYQPASMTKTSAPASAADSMSGRSRSVVGSPFRVFM